MPGSIPLMNILFRGPFDFPISLSGSDVRELLKSSLRKIFGRYGGRITPYEVPISLMLHDILEHGNVQ